VSLNVAYPGWATLIDKLTEKRLKASDLKGMIGLTYRQLNDWDERGMLKSTTDGMRKEKGAGWRKFSIAELVPIAILKALRGQGIPLSKLHNVRAALFFEEVFFIELIPAIVEGIDTYFLTDLQNHSGYDSLDPSKDTFEIPKFVMEELSVGVFLSVNPMVKMIFEKLNLSDFEAIEMSDGSYSFKINGVPLALENLKDVQSHKKTHRKEVSRGRLES
jgi:MerR-like DNA binding protein